MYWGEIAKFHLTGPASAVLLRMRSSAPLDISWPRTCALTHTTQSAGGSPPPVTGQLYTIAGAALSTIAGAALTTIAALSGQLQTISGTPLTTIAGTPITTIAGN